MHRSLYFFIKIRINKYNYYNTTHWSQTQKKKYNPNIRVIIDILTITLQLLLVLNVFDYIIDYTIRF